MTLSRLPWSVSAAGLLVLLAAGLGALVQASDPPSREYGLPVAALVGLLGVGLLIRWRYAVWGGLALIPLSLPLTVAALRADDGTPLGRLGVMLVLATTVLLFLLLPAVPALRGKPVRGPAPAADAAPAPVQPAPDGPTLAQRLLFVVFATASFIVGALVTVTLLLFLTSAAFRSGRSMIAIIMFAVVLMIFATPMVLVRPRRRPATFALVPVTVDGLTRQAFLARFDRPSRSVVPIGLVCPAVIGVWQLIKADLPPAVWAPAAGLTALAAGWALALPATGWRTYVALTPAGLHVPGPLRPTTVPWRAVERGHLTRDLNGGAYVTVAVRDPAAVTSSLAGRLVRLVRRRFGGDLRFPAQPLTVQPGFLAYAISAYRSDPGRRRDVGTVQELERLHSEWIRERRPYACPPAGQLDGLAYTTTLRLYSPLSKVPPQVTRANT